MFSFPYRNELMKYLTVTALDELTDRITCFLTAFICATLTIVIHMKSGTNIECLTPATYTRAWEQFAEGYCFLKDTYWYPIEKETRDSTVDYKKVFRIKYYQWICMYLMAAAVVAMFPKLVWKASENVTDMPILQFCETAAEHRKDTPDDRKKEAQKMAELLKSKLERKPSRYSMSRIRVMTVYKFIKFLYLIISFLQFYMLGIFLGKKNMFWGYDLTMKMYNRISWKKSGIFPRVTFCDFVVHEHQGHTREETIQCFLPLNEYNEMIFIGLWFYFLIAFILTIMGCLRTFIFFGGNYLSTNLLYNIMIAVDVKNENEINDTNKFAKKYLKGDGILVLSFVSSQSEKFTREVAFKMWELYMGKIEPLPKEEDEDTDKDADNNDVDIETDDKKRKK